VRVAARPGASCLFLCCTLCACALSRWYERQFYDSFHYETVEPRPAVHPYYVRVFLFEAPDGAFDVIGTLGCTIEDGRGKANEHHPCRDVYAGCGLDRADLERYIPYVRDQAGRRGADVVWIQSDTIKRSVCESGGEDSISYDCYVHVLEGVLGRRRSAATP
jgi:hypothetical protein